jgi:hypothetical protein
MDPHKTKQQVGKCIVGALLVLGRATSKFRLTNSPQPGLEGSHHLPPYSIFCASPRGPHPNGILSRDSQMGVPKFSQLGFPQLCRPIILRIDLQLKWSLKKSYSIFWKLFNGMLHATCTRGIWGDSWLLVVRSQIANLIFGPSFGHNLCFKCPNGSCELILDIYVSRNFEWYKELLNPLSFDPCNHSLKI